MGLILRTGKHHETLYQASRKNTQPTHSALFQAIPKAQEFKETKSDKMLPQKSIETAQTEWAAHIVFSPKTK